MGTVADCTCGGLPSGGRKCKPCSREYMRQWRIRRPGYDRTYRIRAKHGLEPEQLQAMMEAQGGGCAVCGGQSDPGFSLAVDHDHTTGKVRGLLCSNCNRGLGLFADSPARLEAAAAYLRSRA